jgi:glucosamine-6-phosphate isomerase
MKVLVFKNYDQMCRAAADLIVDQVKRKPNSLLCFPSGDSPTGIFKYLIADSNEKKVDFSECYFVGLDEWVGMSKDDEGSCTHFLNKNFFTPMQINPDKIQFFDACAQNLDAACTAMDDFIKEKGPIDIMLVGVGINGHIGLNEPGTDFDLYSHHSSLAPVTISVAQKYFKKETPLREGITLGLKHLEEANTAVLIAAGIKKAEIIAEALQGDVTEQLPASIFQAHPSAYVLLDEDAASKLVH